MRWVIINESDSKVDVEVNDVMSSPAITVHLNDAIHDIATLMRSKKVGSVIVMDNNENPIGIITERDILDRIVARDLKPSEVKAEVIMSKPLRAIDSSASIAEASKNMRDRGVRRLIVIKGSKLAGIISSDDIARITPELITIISEKSNMKSSYPVLKESGITGQCEICNNWSDNMRERNGLFYCENCSQ